MFQNSAKTQASRSGLKRKSRHLGLTESAHPGFGTYEHERPGCHIRSPRWPDSLNGTFMPVCLTSAVPHFSLRAPALVGCWQGSSSAVPRDPADDGRFFHSAVLQSFLRFMSMGSVRYGTKAVQTLPGRSEQAHPASLRCEKCTRTKRKGTVRPFGNGCRHLPGEAFLSVSDQCQVAVGRESAHPPRRRE